MRESKARWLLSAALLFGGAATFGAACGSDPPSLSVDLRTDLVPGLEFARVVTAIPGAAAIEHGADEPAQAFTGGVRVADFAGLEPGRIKVDVKLLDEEGNEVVVRQSRVTLTEDYALTVVVTRNCAGVVCPEPEGDAALTTCHAGHCVSPECTVDNPSACGGTQCDESADCTTTVPCICFIRELRAGHGTDGQRSRQPALGSLGR